MSDVQNNKSPKDFVHSVLQNVDLSKPAINIFILDRGDMSRYHEIIALSYWRSEWHLVEDYLTPEYSFKRETHIEDIQLDTLTHWLESIVIKNQDVFLNNKSCPKNGLLLP